MQAFLEKERKIYWQTVSRNRRTGFQGLLCLASLLFWTEKEDVIPFSRLLLLVLLLFAYRAYNKANALADTPMLVFGMEEQLREAASQDNLERVELLLLKLGLKHVNAEDPDKLRSPLHYAVAHQALRTAKYLKEVGADVNLQDKEGNTPIHYAILLAKKHKKYEILLELLGKINNPLLVMQNKISASQNLSGKNPTDPRYLTNFFASQQPGDTEKNINFNINPLLKNKEGHTLLTLLETISDKTDQNFLIALGTVRYLTELHQRGLKIQHS